jgi:hypothetical protein
MKPEINIEKLLQNDLPMLEEKLYILWNEIQAELTTIRSTDPLQVQALLLDDFIKTMDPQLNQLIKKDNYFILPYLRKIMELFRKGNKQEALLHFGNIIHPLTVVLQKQSKIMEELQELRRQTNNFNLFFVHSFRLQQLIMHLFEFYQHFEKYLFIEENILLPGIQHLLEPEETVFNSNQH